MVIKIKIGNKIVNRKVNFFSLGNFVNNIVRIKNKLYWLGNGDEYIRGYKEEYNFEDLNFYKLV